LRNSQGLNPDTLHDTATGAMAMLSNAQKAVRVKKRAFPPGFHLPKKPKGKR
jgi:hypothetical protein